MSYSSEVLADSPLAYWRLGETSGTTAADSSGNGRSGTYLNTPTLGVAGMIYGDTDKAMQASSGSGKCMSVASAAWMAPAVITAEVLVTFLDDTPNPGSGDAIFSHYGSGGLQFLIWRNPSKKMAVQFGNSAGTVFNVADTANVVPGKRYHVVATMDGSTCRLYVNGTQVGGDVAFSGTLSSGGTNALEVARYSATNTYTPSAVFDEAAIYDHALTSTRIAAHYSAAGSDATQMWDFRSLSALPSGWARRGVASETFGTSGVSATYAAGQGHYYPITSATEGTLEVKMTAGPLASSMLGPILDNAGVQGATVAWYSGPSGALLLGVNSSYQYDGSYINTGGSPAYPAYFRVKMSYGVAFGSFSTDGTTWSTEQPMSRTSMATLNEVGFGAIYGSASATIEYAKWTSPNRSGSTSANVAAPAATATAAAFVPTVSADLSATAPAASASAAALAPVVSGGGDAVVAPPAASATASALPPTVAADSTLAVTAATASAAALVPTVSLSATIAAPVADASAAAVAPFVDNGSGSQTVAPPAATATADALAPLVLQIIETSTDTSNNRHGRRRLAYATATVTRPVAAPPDTLTLATKVDKALAYPAPTMVNGRPT